MTTKTLPSRSWFRRRGGYRFFLECALIIAAKLVVLTAIWVICFRPFPRPDTSPVAVEQHLTSSTAAETTTDQHRND